MRRAHSDLLFAAAALLAVAAAPPLPAPAATVYDNTVNALASNSYNPGSGREHGDEIALAGIDRVVTDFEFLYQLSSGDGTETARVRFYENDGPGGEPGTLLYDSGDFPLPIDPSGFTTYAISGLSVPVPDTFTWTVSFEIGPTFALNALYDPPVVGSSDNDVYWTRVGTDPWTEGSFGLPDRANFYAHVEALPEPSLAAGLLAGAAGLAALRPNRRRAP